MIQILSRRAEYSSGSQRDLGMEGEAFRGWGLGMEWGVRKGSKKKGRFDLRGVVGFVCV